MFSFGSLYLKNDSKKNSHSGVGMVFLKENNYIGKCTNNDDFSKKGKKNFTSGIIEDMKFAQRNKSKKAEI